MRLEQLQTCGMHRLSAVRIAIFRAPHALFKNAFPARPAWLLSRDLYYIRKTPRPSVSLSRLGRSVDDRADVPVSNGNVSCCVPPPSVTGMYLERSLSNAELSGNEMSRVRLYGRSTLSDRPSCHSASREGGIGSATTAVLVEA